MKHTFSRLLSFSFPLLLCLFIKPMMAQVQSNVVVQPDCIASFVFTTTGTQQINNISAACLNWTVDYTSTGFSAISLVVETAPNASGVPGSWSTFTAATGSNPNTSAVGATSTFASGTAYYAFVRVNLASITGTGKVTGTLYGYKNGAAAGSGGGGGGTVISNLTVCSNGSNTLTSAPFTFTSPGNTQIVAASAGKTITVCGFVSYTDAATFLKLTQGTGANCGSSTTDVTSYPTGSSYTILGLAVDFPLVLAISDALCVNSAANVNGGGAVLYVQK